MLLVGEGGQVEVSHVGTIPVKGEKISQIKETNIFQSGEMKEPYYKYIQIQTGTKISHFSG